MSRFPLTAMRALLPLSVCYVAVIPDKNILAILVRNHLGDTLPSETRIVLFVVILIMLDYHALFYLFVGKTIYLPHQEVVEKRVF